MSDKLLATIQGYKDKIAELEAENEKLKKCCSQRGARMQLMMEFLESRRCNSSHSYWVQYCSLTDGAYDWFDKDGVPK